MILFVLVDKIECKKLFLYPSWSKHCYAYNNAYYQQNASNNYIAVSLESMSNTVQSIAYSNSSEYFSAPLYNDTPGTGRPGGVSFTILKDCDLELYFHAVCYITTAYAHTYVTHNSNYIFSTTGTISSSKSLKVHAGDIITVQSIQTKNAGNIILFTATVI